MKQTPAIAEKERQLIAELRELVERAMQGAHDSVFDRIRDILEELHGLPRALAEGDDKIAACNS